VTAAAAWRSGINRAVHAPQLLLLLWCITLVVTAPAALTLRSAIESHLGSSLAADEAADGVNYDWMQEFRSMSGPLGRTLRPEVIGGAAALDNLDAVADMQVQSTVVTLAASAYLLLTWFAAAGIIVRLGAAGPIGAAGFGAACGAYAGRLLRLALVAAVVYGFLFVTIYPLLAGELFDLLTSNLTVERSAFAVRLAIYAIFFVPLGLVIVVFDFARVRLVLEDRPSVIVALAAGAAFVAGNRRLAVGIGLFNAALYAVLVVAYTALAPGAGSGELQTWAAFLFGQVYVAARLAVKLTAWGAQVAAIQALQR
jgi:hypothetical protein